MNTINYIGFGRRFIAYFIDTTLLFIIIFSILMTAGFLSPSYNYLSDEQHLKFVDNWLRWLFPFVPLLYFTLLESSKWQATLGKKVMKIKVTNRNNERLTLLNALGRHLAKILSMLALGLGFIVIIFTKKKQGLHDLLAKSYVVSTQGKAY